MAGPEGAVASRDRPAQNTVDRTPRGWPRSRLWPPA